MKSLYEVINEEIKPINKKMTPSKIVKFVRKVIDEFSDYYKNKSSILHCVESISYSRNVLSLYVVMKGYSNSNQVHEKEYLIKEWMMKSFKMPQYKPAEDDGWCCNLISHELYDIGVHIKKVIINIEYV